METLPRKLEDWASLIDDVEKLKARHSPRYQRIVRTLEPVVGFFARFSPAIDAMAQYGTSPAALVWGALKSLVMLAQKSIAYSTYIEHGLTKLRDIISISPQCDEIWGEEKHVKIALTDLYNEMYNFIRKLLEAVRESFWRVFFKSVGKDYEEDFRNNLDQLDRYKHIFDEQVTLAHRKRLELNMYASVQMNSDYKREGDREALFRWLSTIDPRVDYIHSLDKRLQSTGQWLLCNSIFTAWSKLDEISESRILWIHGRPGSGKTILSATAIQHLEEYSRDISSGLIPVTYFYCNSIYDQNDTVSLMCGSILSQIAATASEIPMALETAYKRAQIYGRRRTSSADELSSVLGSVASSLPALYIVLDGVDECDEPGKIVNTFTNIARQFHSIHLCLFSRNIPAVKNELTDAVVIPLERDIVRPDIDRYLIQALKKQPIGEDHHVFERLSHAADGMFLFAALSVQELTSAVHLQSVEETIRRLPSGIDEVYKRILEKIENQGAKRKHLARKIFLWVCCATRPLSWSELQYALSWNQQEKAFISRQRPYKDEVLRLCSPLIEYHADSDTFHVAHFSVKEFLCNSTNMITPIHAQFLIKESDAHREISEALLSVLTMPPAVRSIRVDLMRFPLIKYATENWTYHLTLSPFEPDLARKYSDFTSDPRNRLLWILRFLLFAKKSFPLQQLAKFQKSVQDWKGNNNESTTYNANDLADLQRALIYLDKHSDIIPHEENISNFERLMTVRDLARAYTMTGHLDQGVELFSSAIRATRALRGNESLKLPWLFNSLGILYDQQKRTELAITVQMQALRIQERRLPPDHLDSTLTINELGRLQRHLGKFKEAESYHLRALTILRDVLPETDIQIIWTINTLARSYRREGRFDEAIEYHRQALAGQSRLLGETHPHALWTRGDIARCLRGQGKNDEARKTLEEVVNQRSIVLGPLHPDTLWSMNSLGIVHEEMGHISEAKELHSRALHGQEKVLGMSHAHTKWSRDTLSKLA
ncbi:hypothetical protein F5884DRAFT_875740 [Xylogone sp. PMI_703]|nr:hypothetical protein F5884DRAFT_875740 [Xylogone sp. PMI_703]